MFDIPLMGDNTGSVEALPSYLHRCARHHGVRTSKFLEYLHAQQNKPSNESNAPRFKASQTISMNSLLTYGWYPKMYVDLIKELTGRNVIRATFLPLIDVVTQPLKEIHRGILWCPECFAAIRDIGEEPYIKLIWHLSELTHCPHHLTTLLDECAHCYAKQNAVGRKAALDICHKCGGDLKDRGELASLNIKPTWIHEAVDLLRLFAGMAHRTDPFFCPDGHFSLAGLKKSINDFSAYCTDPEFDQSYRYCWTDKDIRRQIWGNEKISLRALRILAHLTNVDIFDVLTGNLINKARTLPFSWQIELPDILNSVRKRKKQSHEKNFTVLNTLAQAEPPLSLKEVLRRSGLSLGYISYRFPVLKQKIVERFMKYTEQLSLEKHQCARQEALRYFCSTDYIGHPKSRKQALRHLLNDTSLTKMYLKPAIQEAYKNTQIYE